MDLTARIDAYNATLSPDVHASETARAGLALLRETACLVLASGNETSAEQRAFANSIMSALDSEASE